MAKTKTRKKRILMVDDEQDINVTIKTVLEDAGSFQVDTFNDAESALSLFGPGLYDLALLDIRMPKMNGFQLCRKLREMDKELKICFLTATELLYFRDTDSDVIDDLGTHCFVAKPVDTIDLIDRLKVILSQNDR
jgi:DNA-binding response OmpR family regulator